MRMRRSNRTTAGPKYHRNFKRVKAACDSLYSGQIACIGVGRAKPALFFFLSNNLRNGTDLVCDKNLYKIGRSYTSVYVIFLEMRLFFTKKCGENAADFFPALKYKRMFFIQRQGGNIGFLNNQRTIVLSRKPILRSMDTYP